MFTSTMLVFGATLSVAATTVSNPWTEVFTTRTRGPPALVVNPYRLYRALAYLTPPPSESIVHYVSFNNTAVTTGEANGGGELGRMLAREAAVRGRGGGGLAYQALYKASHLLPYDSAILLVTPEKPIDKQLDRFVIDTIIAKRTKVFLIWTGSEDPGDLGKSVIRTGGTVFNNQPARLTDGKQLHKVTLLVRGGLKDEWRTKFLVDPYVKRMTVIVSGRIDLASIRSPTGSWSVINGRETNLEVGTDFGEWEIRASGSDYDLEVEALSSLAFVALPHTGKKRSEVEVEVRGTLEGNRVDDIHLLDDEGITLAELHYNSSLPRTIPLSDDLTRRISYLHLYGRNNKGVSFERLSRMEAEVEEDERRKVWLPSSIEVELGSTLLVEPGQTGRIVFKVTNRRRQPSLYSFLVHDNRNLVRGVHPLRASLEPDGSVIVNVDLVAQGRDGWTSGEGYPAGEDIVALTAQQRSLLPPPEIATVTKRAYFRVGSKNSDRSRPVISYSYAGDCRDSLSPKNCYASTWSAQVTIQDSESGLLSVATEPYGLTLDKEFIVGTRDPLVGQFSASCCTTKLYVRATDIKGNSYQTTIDIETLWLSAGEIAAIVLATLLLIVIIILLVVGVVACVRRRRAVNYYVN